MALNSDKPSPEFSFRTRHHFWLHLKNNKNIIANIVVVGGGIVGAGLLRELGLQNIPLVFLFERNDFASGTSGASSKLIHAGVRYLETAWVHFKAGRVKEAFKNFLFVCNASRERKILGQIAPHLINPKKITLILGQNDTRSPFSVALGIWLYYLIQLFQGQFFTPPNMAFRPNAIKLAAPEADADKVKAIFTFWDSETDDARLVIENIQAGHEMGCYAMNYVECVSYSQEDTHVSVNLRNKENNETLTLKTKILINAAGPWVDELRKRSEHSKNFLVEPIAGAHIDIYPAITVSSYYVTAGDGRLIFLLARNEDGLSYTRIGTTERRISNHIDENEPHPTLDEINYLIRTTREFFPFVAIDTATIVRRDAGIRPLRSNHGSNLFYKSREHDIISDRRVYHVVGVKLTDYRRVSNELIRLLPWKEMNLRLSDPDQSEWITLRESHQNRMYIEETIGEMIRRTMVLHWKDYVARRRGLAPIILEKVDPIAYESEFRQMKDIMNWNDEQALDERNAI